MMEKRAIGAFFHINDPYTFFVHGLLRVRKSSLPFTLKILRLLKFRILILDFIRWNDLIVWLELISLPMEFLIEFFFGSRLNGCR